MEVFLTVVAQGSFTAAARIHGMSGTMVAKHITSLEKRLAAQLFFRSTRLLRLTNAGRCYAERCGLILRDIADADSAASMHMSTASGRLRISAPQVYGSRRIAPLVVGFLQDYPKAEIDLVMSDRKVDLIKEEYDFAFRIGDVDDDWLVSRELGDHIMVLAAAPSYLEEHGTPLIPDHLSAHQLLGFSQWSSDKKWSLWDGLVEHVVMLPEQNLRINNGDALRAAAVAGRGIVLQPALTLEDDLSSGRLRLIMTKFQPLPKPVRLLYPFSVNASLLCRLFIERALQFLST